MSQVLKSAAEAIGNTPLVRLDRLTKLHGVKGSILAKLEYLNPGFSKKDRAALGIIEEAEFRCTFTWANRGRANLRKYGNRFSNSLWYKKISFRSCDV